MGPSAIPLNSVAFGALDFRWTLRDLLIAEARLKRVQQKYTSEKNRWTKDNTRHLFGPPRHRITKRDLFYKACTGRTPAEDAARAAEEARLRPSLEAIAPAEESRNDLRRQLITQSPHVIEGAIEVGVTDLSPLALFQRTWAIDDVQSAEVAAGEIVARASMAMRQEQVPRAAALHAARCLYFLECVDRLWGDVARSPETQEEWQEGFRRHSELQTELRRLAPALMTVAARPDIDGSPSLLHPLLKSMDPYGPYSVTEHVETASQFFDDLSRKLALPEVAAALASPSKFAVAPAPEGDDRTGEAAVFEKVGPVRRIVYGGKRGFVVNGTGCDYLEYLLVRVGKECPVVEVWASTLEKPELAATVTDRGEAKFNGAAWDKAKGKFRELVADRDAAKARGDAKAQLRAQEEMAALGAQMEAAKGAGGRDRRIGDAAQRLAHAVREAIRRTFNDIDAQHEELGQHLRKHVKRGLVLKYNPPEPIHWHV